MLNLFTKHKYALALSLVSVVVKLMKAPAPSPRHTSIAFQASEMPQFGAEREVYFLWILKKEIGKKFFSYSRSLTTTWRLTALFARKPTQLIDMF